MLPRLCREEFNQFSYILTIVDNPRCCANWPAVDQKSDLRGYAPHKSRHGTIYWKTVGWFYNCQVNAEMNCICICRDNNFCHKSPTVCVFRIVIASGPSVSKCYSFCWLCAKFLQSKGFAFPSLWPKTAVRFALEPREHNFLNGCDNGSHITIWRNRIGKLHATERQRNSSSFSGGTTGIGRLSIVVLCVTTIAFTSSWAHHSAAFWIIAKMAPYYFTTKC